MSKNCVMIKGKCLPKKKLDTLYEEFASEMSVNPFIDDIEVSDEGARGLMAVFMEDRHPRMKNKGIWVEGLFYIYETEAK